MTGTENWQFIADARRLEEVCRTLGKYDWLAIDTEFIREKTYFPQLCLLQIGTPDEVFCIDPLALEDLGPLLTLLYDPDITKVFHAGRQDLEIFFHLTGGLPKPVFDSQIAALLLGYPDQAGYAVLVEKVLGVRLDKSQARTDWAQRPLPPERLRYAADDVRYLVLLYQRLYTELEKRGRLEWLSDDFAKLTDPATYVNEPDEAWRRIRGADRLNGRQQAVLQALAAWRERTASATDQPRGWLIRDDTLVDIARLRPKVTGDFAKIRSLRAATVQQYGDQLLEAIRSAAERQVPAAATLPRAVRLDTEQQALVDVLMATVRLRAAANALNPAMLASRKDLERLVAGQDDGKILQGWRRNIIGEELLALLHGERELRVVDGALRVDGGV